MHKILLLALVAFAATWSRAQEPPTTQGAWITVDIGIIGTASEDVLNSAVEAVKDGNHAGLVIRLDTPGGALENTRNMVKTIMGAPFPVIVWVGPAGSRAGSAGAFITLAGHVAAMAPGTNIGAAHPVQASGEDVGKGEMDRKVTNDTIAFIESIAQKRGRNVDMARSFVATSVSITDTEALEHKVIDLTARDIPSLLEAADGREVTLEDGKKVTLATKGATTISHERTFRQKALEILSNPNLFYLLFMAGLIGLGYELTHPGMIFPGVVGAICMILALIATSVLPVSWGAAALVLVGVAMMVGEAFLPTFGILGVGGFVAFVLGSVFLVDPRGDSGLRISWWVIAPGAITVGVAFVGLGFLVLRSTKSTPKSGREAMIGQEAVALDAFPGGKGQVRVAGAIWSARFAAGADPMVNRGDALTVRAVDGLVVEVVKRS